MCSNFKNRRIIWTTKICLIGHLCQLLGILNKLWCHFEGIAEEAERDIDSFEELATPAIVSTARNEGVGRPGLALAQEQLETLHGEAGFRWANIAGILGVSERTVCLRRLEFGLPETNKSSLSLGCPITTKSSYLECSSITFTLLTAKGENIITSVRYSTSLCGWCWMHMLIGYSNSRYCLIHLWAIFQE